MSKGFDFSLLLKRLNKKIDAFKSDSPEMQTAMLTIGALLRTQTILNIREQKLIDRGHLINSINFKTFKRGNNYGVAVGSFGIRYAAVHEFGFNGRVVVKSHTRTRDGKSFNVQPHERMMNIKARSYLRPAVTKNTTQILNLIREASNI